MAVTAGRKGQHFLELTSPAEATVQKRRQSCSPVNFRRMCWFLNHAVPYR